MSDAPRHPVASDVRRIRATHERLATYAPAPDPVSPRDEWDELRETASTWGDHRWRAGRALERGDADAYCAAAVKAEAAGNAFGRLVTELRRRHEALVLRTPEKATARGEPSHRAAGDHVTPEGATPEDSRRRV